MIDSTKAVAAASKGGTPSAQTAAKQSVKSFASVLAKSSAETDAAKTTNIEPRPDGEQTKRVAGHPYSKILNGDDKGMYVNQVTGNPRMGRAFKLVERDDHVFHVYGTGKDRVIIGLPQKDTTVDAKATTGDSTATTKS